MFERFTDRARKVMALANQEAQRFNHEYIGTEHILLGLVKEGSGVGATVLGRSRVGAALSGAALLAGSVLTRFGIFGAGIQSAKDPRYTVQPQKERLAQRRARGDVSDSITTGR